MNSATDFFAIVNPVSGVGKAGRKWPAVQQYLQQKNIPFQFAITTPNIKADLIVQDAIAKGYRKIICVGGDGNLHDMLNGIMKQKHCPTTDICVAMISLGTGNDWIKTSGIPLQFKKAIDLLNTGKEFVQDVGLCTYYINGEKHTRCFHNFAGVGFDAYVVERTIKLKQLGTIAYLLGVVQCLFTFKKPVIKIEVNGRTIETITYMALAGIGQYGGGGMKLTPGAVLNDGKFFLSIAKNLSVPEVIINLAKLYDGTFINLDKVETMECTSLKIEAPADIKIQADGDVLGTGPFEISILPAAFKILVP